MGRFTLFVTGKLGSGTILAICIASSGGGGGDSFANITLAISSRCFLVLLLSLGAFHKLIGLRANFFCFCNEILNNHVY